jgi:AcrR family transcriptional regulator
MDRYHHGNLKAVLLKVAFQLVGKLGIEGFTLRELARRAGVSHNAPYRHFKSKEDLVAALAAEAFHQLHAALEKAAAGVADPKERLCAAARTYLHFALQNPSRFNLMFHSPLQWKNYPKCAAAYAESWNLLAETMRECQGGGDVETSGEVVWSTIHGITELGIARHLREGKVAELASLVDAAVRVLLDGLAVSTRQQASR